MPVDELQFQTGIVKEATPNEQARSLLEELPGWHIESGPPTMLVASYDFGNFVEALDFANRVGELAERYDHHPALLVEYGSVKVSWWTHTANGIALNDFFMARETNKLAR